MASGDLGGTTTSGTLQVSGSVDAPFEDLLNPVAFNVGSYTSEAGQSGHAIGHATVGQGLIGFAPIRVGSHDNTGGTGC